MKRKGLNSDVIRGASGNIYQASILIPLVVYEGIFDSDGCTPEYQASVFSREESRVKNVTVPSWSCNEKNRTIYYVDAVYRKCILNLCNSCFCYGSSDFLRVVLALLRFLLPSALGKFILR